MLKDTITYGGQSVLTIYHENKELDISGRHWQEREKIGRYWLVFEESSGHPEGTFPAKDAVVERELLSHDHPLSPCGSHEFCAVMTRQRARKKPSHIFLQNCAGFRLEQGQWECLCKFVKRYTGMDLLEAPMACGDTFLFHYVQLCYYETKEGSILVDSSGFDRIDIHFMRKKVICDSQTRHLSPSEQTKIEFISDEDWDSFDIFAYDEDKLWFYAKDVAFFQSLSLTMGLGDDRSVPLKRSDYHAKYANLGSQEIIKIGQEKTNLRLQQDQQEAHILTALTRKKESSYLIQKGDDHIVYSVANKLLDHRWDEVLLLDPYLLDAKGKDALIDWMRLLCGSPSKHICAVYYCKAEADNAITIAEARNMLSMDWPLSQILRRNSSVLRLVGLNEYIHDRFLLCRTDKEFAGIALGTSLNSLNSNYFCVHNLTETFVKECWETFDALIRSHTVETEVI